MLSKKGIETLDALSLAAQQKANAPAVVEVKPVRISTISDQEKKNLQRRLSQVEKEISTCESFIKEKEVQLADPDFYQSTGFQKEVRLYEDKKAELEKFMTEWESIAEKLAVS